MKVSKMLQEWDAEKGKVYVNHVINISGGEVIHTHTLYLAIITASIARIKKSFIFLLVHYTQSWQHLMIES